jgi:hypothetical protein
MPWQGPAALACYSDLPQCDVIVTPPPELAGHIMGPSGASGPQFVYFLEQLPDRTTWLHR